MINAAKSQQPRTAPENGARLQPPTLCRNQQRYPIPSLGTIWSGERWRWSIRSKVGFIYSGSTEAGPGNYCKKTTRLGSVSLFETGLASHVSKSISRWIELKRLRVENKIKECTLLMKRDFSQWRECDWNVPALNELKEEKAMNRAGLKC